MKTLSPRELCVFQAASEGVTYPVLARREGTSVRTLQNAGYRGMKKLGVHSMPHAVSLCIIHGWIPGPLVSDRHE